MITWLPSLQSLINAIAVYDSLITPQQWLQQQNAAIALEMPSYTGQLAWSSPPAIPAQHADVWGVMTLVDWLASEGPRSDLGLPLISYQGTPLLSNVITQAGIALANGPPFSGTKPSNLILVPPFQ